MTRRRAAAEGYARSMRNPTRGFGSIPRAGALVLLLAGGGLAQVSVGGASIGVGEEIVVGGGPGGKPRTFSTGVKLEVGLVGPGTGEPASGRASPAFPRFARESCGYVQVKLEGALKRRRARRPKAAEPDLGPELFRELEADGFLDGRPDDPQAASGYGWWNWQRDAEGRISCREHGPWRRMPEPVTPVPSPPSDRLDATPGRPDVPGGAPGDEPGAAPSGP